MGKWATYQRRGSATVPPAGDIVLANPESTTLTWTYLGADPAYWQMDYSTDGGSSWDYWDVYPGTERSDDAFDPGKRYRISALDADNNVIAGPSNVVAIP